MADTCEQTLQKPTGLQDLSIPHMRSHPSVLTSAAQAHAHPFSGLADLIDNSRESGAKLMSIDVVRRDEQRPLISLTDDGCGMDECSLTRLLSMGYTEKDRETGQHYGMGTKTAIARLCSHALIFSCAGAVRTVGLLSAKLFGDLKATEMFVPQCSWDSSDDVLQITSERAPLTHQQRLDSLQLILEHSPFKPAVDEEGAALRALIGQFRHLPETGTRIIMWDVRKEVTAPSCI